MGIQDILNHFASAASIDTPQSGEEMSAPNSNWLPDTTNFKDLARQWNGPNKTPQTSDEEKVLLGLNKKENESNDITLDNPVASSQSIVANAIAPKKSIPKTSPASDVTAALSQQLSGPEPASTSDQVPSPLDGYQAKLDAALQDRKDNMNSSVLRGAATDLFNAGLMATGNPTRLTPGYGDQRLNDMSDLKLKDLQSNLALSGQVKTSEEAKHDLGDLTDTKSPEANLYRTTISKLYNVDPSTMKDLSIEQMQKSLGILAPAVDKQMQIEHL